MATQTTELLNGDKGRELSPKMRKRQQLRDEWDAYWKVRYLDSKDNWYYRCVYLCQRYLIDWPVTKARENIIEPMWDKYKKPYYHYKLNRVPEIDQCGVLDKVFLLGDFLGQNLF